MFPALNLLPPEQKKEAQRVKTLLLVHEIILFVFIAVVFGSGTLLAARLMLEQKFREVMIENVPGAAKIIYLNRDIQNLNKRLAVLEEITSKSPFWSAVILEIIARTPSQINYKSLNILNGETIKLSGTAKTRDELMNFKNTLGSSSYIANVDLPLRYLVKQQDVDFNLEITLNPDKLQ